MSKYHWIIDAGHGGIKNGVYQTFPDKMFKFEDGLVIYEGVVNRGIARKLYLKLVEKEIEFSLVYDEELDYTLTKRVDLANKVFSKHPNAIFLSIHSNAGGGTGNEIFTSPGQTKSDLVADIFCEVYKRDLCEFRFRSAMGDGDPDKEENFTVLTKTICPALLVENLFFDNRKEAEFLLSEYGQQRISDCLLNAILETEQKQPI